MEELITARLLATAAVVDYFEDRVRWVRQEPEDGPRTIVMHRTGGRDDNHFKGFSGLVFSRLQINCMGETPLAAKTGARAVKAALRGYRDATIRGVFIDQDVDPDAEGQTADTPIYRSRLDLRVWHKDL